MTGIFDTIKTSTLSGYLPRTGNSCPHGKRMWPGWSGPQPVWEQPIERLADSGFYGPLQYVTKKQSLKIFCLANNIFHCSLDSDAAIRAQLKTLDNTFGLTEA